MANERDLKLLAKVTPDWRQGESRQTPLDQWVKATGLTRRSVQYWLQRLEKDKWIKWQSRRGRGHIPDFTLLKKPDEWLQDQALNLMELGESREALNLVSSDQRSTLLERYLNRGLTDNQDLVQVLYIPFYRAIHDLNPRTATRRTEGHILDHLHRGLLAFDPDTQKLVPSIAHHWQTKPNGYRFFLRKNIFFHNGEQLTAACVKEAFRAPSHSNHANDIHFNIIKSVSVIDDWTVDIQLKWHSPIFLHILTLNVFAITKTDAKHHYPIGCGPFKLLEQTPERTVLQSFDLFFGYRPYLDRVEFWTLKNSRVHLDINAHIISARDGKGLSGDYKNVRKLEVGAHYLVFNQKKRKSGFSQLSVRQYLAGMLDKSKLLSGYKEKFVEASCFEPQRQGPAHAATTSKHRPFTNLSIVTYKLNSNLELARWIQECLSHHNVQCKLTVLDYPEFCQRENRIKHDIVLAGEVFDEDKLLSYFDFFMANSVVTDFLPKPARQQLEGWVRKATVAVEEAEMMDKLRNVEVQAIKNLFWLPLFHHRQHMLVSSKIKDNEINAFGWLNFDRIWLEH